MKNIVTIIVTFLITFAVAIGGAYYFKNYEASIPENKIINTWESNGNITEITFKRDGQARMIMADTSIKAIYNFDAKTSEMSLIYTFLDNTYTRHFVVTFEKNKMILYDKDAGATLTYTSA